MRRILPLIAALLLAVCSYAADKDAPVIRQVDPPNWWIDLGSPMLLLHGDHLTGAQFRLADAHGARIVRQQLSENGHWAFVWLDTSHAREGGLSLLVRTPAGQTSQTFELAARHRSSAGFAGFSPDDVIYLIMPDRFADGDTSNDPPASDPGTFNRSLPRAYHGGDLSGVLQHLDYLQALGVTTLWTTPLYDNSANHAGDAYHGYSATNMYAVDPHLGTLADLRQLSASLHARGMKLVLDTVPNHVGPHHPWVTDPPTPDWFHGTAAHHIPATGDFASIADPHGTSQARIPPLDGWFADVLPDMNQQNPLVSTYLIQNAEWWIESAQLDGLRIDTFPYVQRDFWRDFHAAIHGRYPHLTTVGEIFNPDPTIVSYFAGGTTRDGIDTGLDTPFDFPVYFALRATLIRGESMKQLAAVLRQDSLYPHPERLIPFEGNHDTKRFLSEASAEPVALRQAFGLLATLRGTPQIYSGDEIAMLGSEDPDNRRDFPGGFPGDPHSAFVARERTPEQAAMHDWVVQILDLRHSHPALRGGAQADLFVSGTVFAFCRSEASDHVLIAVNNSPKPETVRIDLRQTPLDGIPRFRDLLETTNGAEDVVDGRISIVLNPHGFRLLAGE